MARLETGPATLGRPAEADSDDSVLLEAAGLLESSSMQASWIVPGEVLSTRFVVERVMASGGMGTIYRGKDLETGDAVAIKVVTSGRSAEEPRFVRETQLLAELSHPSIVRYIAHGTVRQGARYLAMEWLEGEDLSGRLSHSTLTVDESLALMRRACEGIAAAHARGVVHRDLKPSNLFLVGNDPAQVKVLDFGVSRRTDGTRTLTESGTILGTVGYMSPEQATGPRDVDARADVFALGCVFFECLTGRPAFTGPHPVAVLAKVLSDTPPPVSELRPGISRKIEVLVAGMLAKDPSGRPADATFVLDRLNELRETHGSALPAAPLRPGLTAAERRVVSVILGKPGPGFVPGAAADRALADIQELTRRFDAEPVPIRGGGLLVLFAGGSAATDRANQATRCALAIARARPGFVLTVATGVAETTGRIPVGVAIDRAGALLAGAGDAPQGVVVDELTAGLLDPAFDVRRDAHRGLSVIGERTDADEDVARLLMGRRTAFVGRDKELALLEMTLKQCIEESVARCVLVTGSPGQGKSRLRHEFAARARAGGASVRVLLARADPVSAGSAFILVRKLVRTAARLRDRDNIEEQRRILRAHVESVCKAADANRISDFLEELSGIAGDAPAGAELRAARDDPELMNVWLRRSFSEWLSSSCAITPTLLVIEDLHWGDLPSVACLGSALKALATRPLMLLAVSRPEVHDVFPALWASADTQEIALGRLTPRAAERLVREALGGDADAGVVARIVGHADGNAFYLEELLRRVVEDGDPSLPETVLAVVQSRLEQLAPEGRRIIRAASIFGDLFRRGGIAAVVGEDASQRDVDAELARLVERELLSKADETPSSEDAEYMFRHDFVREAAYAMLTEEDRVKGHALAGDWLELGPEKDALTLANHFERGAENGRAVPWLLQAAQAALDGGHFASTISLSHRGVACAPDDAARGTFELLEAQANVMKGDLKNSIVVVKQAMARLPRGSTEWFRAASTLLWSGSFLGDPQSTKAVVEELSKTEVKLERRGSQGLATFLVVQGLTRIGEMAAAEAIYRRADAETSDAPAADTTFAMWMCCARARLELLQDDIGGALSSIQTARALAGEEGRTFGRWYADLYLLSALCQTGHVERVEEAARRDPRDPPVDWKSFFLSWTLVVTGKADRAISPLRELLDKSDVFIVASARAALVQALLACGQTAEAEAESHLALEGNEAPWTLATALRCRALVELSLQRPDTALVLADRGLSAASKGNYPLTFSLLRLIRAEALHRLGDVDGAATAIRDARDRILRIAATLDDADLRHSYLTRVQAHARTIELASAWLKEPAS